MEFETSRLILRKPKLEDAEDIFRNYTQDEEVTRYLIWLPHANLEVSLQWIQHCIDIWDEETTLPFMIWHKELGQAVGMVEYRVHGFKAELGYVLSRKLWNQGIMTEAGRPIIEHLMARPKLYRIEAIHDLENPASGRVMEKLGMELEGVVRRFSLHPNISDIPRDCKMYSLVKD